VLQEATKEIMKTITRIVLSCLLAVGLAAPALAHHSAAAYNTQQNMTITGTVTEYRFRNPHVYMTVQVKNADGSTSLVEVEAGAASVLGPLGFTKDSVVVGDVVTIAGNPARNAADKSMLGRDLTKKDGTYYPLNIASRSVYVNNGATATSIAGTWFSPSLGGFLGGARNWVVTDKGKAEMAKAGPTTTTQKDCVPIGEPAVMFYPVANTITVAKDRVTLKVDWMDTERVVYLDGRQHPPATQTFLHGHSTGKWEGDTLVIETTNFKEHENGLSTSLPSSTQKKLIERLRVGPDGKNLLYSGTVEDPVYLLKPIEWNGRWEYRPTMQHSNEKCDVDVARKFLKQ
jgi:uncharacterized protein DUF6152